MTGGSRLSDYTYRYCAARFRIGPYTVTHLSITLERDSAFHLATIPLRMSRRKPTGEPGPAHRPARCTTPAGTVHALPFRLPFKSGTFTRIECRDLVEFSRNDDLVLAELVRLLAPGGLLSLRLPAKGPLSALDANNLHHYLVDTTRRGMRPWETAEIGWRRHYTVEDIRHLLDPSQTNIQSIDRRRLGATELGDFAGRLAFRWRSHSPQRYATWVERLEPLHRADERIRSRIGLVYDIQVRKLSS